MNNTIISLDELLGRKGEEPERILIPRNCSYCYLFENINWPFFQPKRHLIIPPKSRTIKFLVSIMFAQLRFKILFYQSKKVERRPERFRPIKISHESSSAEENPFFHASQLIRLFEDKGVRTDIPSAYDLKSRCTIRLSESPTKRTPVLISCLSQ